MICLIENNHVETKKKKKKKVYKSIGCGARCGWE